MAFVLDASVAVGWVVAKQATEYSRKVRRMARRDAYHAPALWRLEVANAVRTLVQRESISVEAARTAIDILERIAPVIHTARSEMSELLELSIRYDLSVYDATYLALALELRLPVACADGRLSKALKPAGLRKF
ncbi:MAG: type II toxin-antitoxin system VapC family toxin [Betaproteobacteria bacterium]|nr:type II toxin-antitoxin system VapC family toxin [Betaproteobacteria bacterium]